MISCAILLLQSCLLLACSASPDGNLGYPKVYCSTPQGRFTCTNVWCYPSPSGDFHWIDVTCYTGPGAYFHCFAVYCCSSSEGLFLSSSDSYYNPDDSSRYTDVYRQLSLGAYHWRQDVYHSCPRDNCSTVQSILFCCCTVCVALQSRQPISCTYICKLIAVETNDLLHISL